MTAEWKRKRRPVLFWLLILLCAAALILTAAKLQGRLRLREEKEAMGAHWEEVLRVNEETSSAMLWAFDYADRFAQENTWESLLQARMACTAAMVRLQELPLPEFTLTQAQYTALADAGIEVDVVEVEYENLSVSLNQHMVTLENLKRLLTDDIYFSASVDMLPDWIQSSRETLELQNAYLCITTNYLQVQMDQKDIWKSMPEQFPVISRSQREWSTSPEQLMEDCGRVLDTLEQQEADAVTYVGISDYTLKVVQEAVQTGSLDRLASQLHTIQGLPTCFPIPQWVTQDILWFYLIQDGQETRMVSAGETLTGLPQSCYLFCGAVSREDVEAYMETLERWNLQPQCAWDGEMKTQQILVSDGTGSLLVEWTQESTVLYLSEPVSCLLPELYLRAMNLQ